MGVCQYDGIKARGIKRKGPAVARLVRGRALDQTAIDEQLPITAMQQKTRSGYFAGGTVKLDIHYCFIR